MKDKKILNYIVPVVYLIICLVISFNRVPFWDEARAWLIAQNCNIAEYLDMMKLECHLFIWYLVIFPFAKLNLLYPYSIYILNSLFASGCIFFLFKSSPFKTYEKLLITFSVPFLFLWGSVARCYSIGILFLFIALSYYKERFNRPYVYFLFLMLSLETSIMAFIGAFYLSILFLFEIRKEKYFKNTVLIFVLFIIITLIQIFSPNPDFLKQNPDMTFLRDFIAYIINPVIYIGQYKIQSILMSVLRLAVDFCTAGFIFYTYKNNKKVLFFTLSSFVSMIVLFGVFYSGNFWHYFYFYLYFIVSIWILKAENNVPKILNFIFSAILICLLFKGAVFIDSKLTTINNSNSKYIAQEILNNDFYKTKKIFCLDPWGDIAPATLPYLKGKINVYDINNESRFSYKSLRNQLVFNNNFFNADNFCKYTDNNSILVSSGEFIKHEENNPKRKINADKGIMEFSGENCNIIFTPYSKNEQKNFFTYLIKVNNKIK